MAMSEQLQQALSVSKSLSVYQNQLRLAKLSFEAKCRLEHQGGQFTITPDTLGYLQHCKDAGVTRTVLLDSRTMPILLQGIDDFIEIASSTYHTALNAYYDEVSRLRNSRLPEKMLETE